MVSSASSSNVGRLNRGGDCGCTATSTKFSLLPLPDGVEVGVVEVEVVEDLTSLRRGVAAWLCGIIMSGIGCTRPAIYTAR